MIRRGDIWWASIPPPSVSEPGYRRPVLIVQTDPFNLGKIGTVVTVAFTTNLRLASAPGNVLCRKRRTGLSKDSVANVSQLTALDKRWLVSRVSALPADLLRQVEDGMRTLLGL